ncbi:hypothetical protein DMB65_10445 [Flavobacterium cheongpyeongense]|uniref:DUF6985 domain-containing protein n=1 Tax=Flavobacterium cheongpyeongense TaxID=2212651 RepID=A0A2V4BR08_9FLAO|nr:hypothetical protein [Flavobacterium cheongpyeongense]PXY40982.1 hypothetical protein DMB65_10445 [Flavobacterium cheongpyeongense]
MRKEIISKIIGRLKQEDRFPDWWKSEEIAIPFFDNEKLRITFMDFEPEHDKTFIDEADLALANFLKLNLNDRNLISELAYKNCIDFLDAVGFDETDEALRLIQNKNEIWKFIQPTEVYVTRRPYKEQDIYVQIACECDWEQEHGLQLVFRQGKKLTRISDQDGHLTEADAYNKPDEEDELLSKF